MKYVIFSLEESQLHPDLGPAFWNNENGWGHLEDATLYDDLEVKGSQPLPNAVWVRVHDPAFPILKDLRDEVRTWQNEEYAFICSVQNAKHRKGGYQAYNRCRDLIEQAVTKVRRGRRV